MRAELRRQEEVIETQLKKRLVELARDMANNEYGAWNDIKQYLERLNENSFRIVLAFNPADGATLPEIEKVVNDNTNQFVKDTQGEFAFDGFDTEYPVHLISFDPEHCTGSKKRHAALMTVQHFMAVLQHKGNAPPCGTLPLSSYGVIESPLFDHLAYYINGGLGEHALPIRPMGQLDYGAAPQQQTQHTAQIIPFPLKPKN